MTYVARLRQLAPPLLLIIVIGLVGNIVSESTQTEVIGVLVNMTIVISLYVFIGNSGIISFGQISFVAIGAFAAGVMTIPSIVKPTLLPELFPFIADNSITSFESMILAMILGAIIAAVGGVALMRLNGLAAGIATFALLQIVHNVLRYWEKIGPGAKSLALIPETTGLWEATLGANYFPYKTRAFRLNGSVTYVDRSPTSSLFGYFVGGQKGPTISVSTDFTF